MIVCMFDEEYQVLTDEQGIMLPMSTVDYYLETLTEWARIHKSHSKLEREAIGRRTLLESFPSMEHQFNWDYFTSGEE